MNDCWQRFLEFCLYTESYRALKKEVKAMQAPSKMVPSSEGLMLATPATHIDMKLAKWRS